MKYRLSQKERSSQRPLATICRRKLSPLHPELRQREKIMQLIPLYHGQRGRSLIEICAAMAIFCIASGLSAPQFSHIRARFNAKGLTNDLSCLLSQMTTLARIYQSDLVLRTVNGQVVLFSRADNSSREGNEKRLRVIPVKKNISVRINTQGQRIFAYTTNTLSPARITISDEYRTCSLTTSLRGRVRSDC